MKQLSASIVGLPAVVMLATAVVAASDHSGQVSFGEVPVHGALVQATQGDTAARTLTDPEGRYVLHGLDDGRWIIQVEIPGFEPMRREVVIRQDASAAEWNLRMLPLEEIQGEQSSGLRTPVSDAVSAVQLVVSAPPPAEAADRLLINGSVVNGAATALGLQRAFGNNRLTARSPYRGQASISGGSSLFDARPYSLTGQSTRQPAYARGQGSFTIGGPLQIPGLFRMGSITLTYGRTQNTNARIETARVPTAAERAGDLSASPSAPIDPETGLPFPGGTIPDERISPQARALLALYPHANFQSAGPFNYQVPVVGTTHGDSVQAAINNIRIGQEQLSGTVNLGSMRSEGADLFGFTDATRSSALAASVIWLHRFTPRHSTRIRYEFSRTASDAVPHFANRQDVSGEAGIAGNDRDPRNWGPPSLSFASGISRLAGGTFAHDLSYSNAVGYTGTWITGRHNIGYGADYRRQHFDLFSQRDARGSFTFTGAQTGSDLADFLLGVPAASSIAFGNADKYFRQSLVSLFLMDDFRLTPSLTVNLGVRWEYESPITERFGRLVNLNIAPDFSSATPVVAGASDQSLIRPDRGGIQPRLGLAWRPSLLSSLVIRAGYGLYRETSVYRAIADQMAQQAPLSKSLTVQHAPDNPLTLADGFRGSPVATATTFAIDPAFKVGMAHNWTLSAQRDLPWSTQATVTYLGIRGTHVPQRILPNTFPAGAENPCPTCPAGFVYLTSNGMSSRHAATIELRRRQRSGFEAGARYTLARATDDAGLGGYHVAQNWLDSGAERGPSNFDRRHELVVEGQWTTGMLARGGLFSDSWREKLLDEWTVAAQLTVGSPLPLTPVILAPVRGTGVTGALRPDLTGAPINAQAADRKVNPAAFAAPAPGQWGTAGRNSIRGPGQFQVNASIARSFRFNERVSIDVRLDATNVLNRVTYPDWNTLVGSTQFGLPTRANPMRTLQPSVRVNF